MNAIDREPWYGGCCRMQKDPALHMIQWGLIRSPGTYPTEIY